MKIFLSAVSAEFRDCRNALASDLRAMGAEVVVQEDFRQQGDTLLKKLETLVASADRIIILAGDAYGWEPEPESRPTGRPRRSYTQWEYAFARGERLDGTTAPPRPVFVYVPDEAYRRDHPVEQDADKAARQRDFLASVFARDKDRNTFGSLDALCRLALRDGFRVRDPDRKPQNLPFRSIGALFKGRDDFLADLHRRFAGSDGQARAIVPARAVHGLGGVGKTRAAVEYAWRFGGDYSALLFVSAPTAADLRTRLADLVGVLAIDTVETAVDARLAEVLRWLDDHPGWLLVIDNVDTEEAAREVEDLLARLTAGHVLITARVSDWGAGVEPLDLHVLAERDAVAFLLDRTASHRRAQADDEGTALTLTRELGHLALALEQAGAYVNKLRLGLGEYLELWESKRPGVLGWHDERLMKYPASVAVSWLTTFDRLGEPERRLLQILSWLAPDPIPLFLFDAEPLARAVPDPRAALAGLAGYSLARFEGEAVEVHRLVQQITREQIPEADRDRRLRSALASVDAVAHLRPVIASPADLWAPLEPHAREVVRHAEQRGSDRQACCSLMMRLARYLNDRARYADAEPLLRRSLEIAEEDRSLFGWTDRVNALSGLAQLLESTSRREEAEPLRRRIVAIFEGEGHGDDPMIAPYLDGLGNLLCHLGRYAEAESVLLRSLSPLEREGGPECDESASTRGALARLYWSTGRYGEAESMFRQVLKIEERGLGAGHPHLAVLANNLAEVLRATRRYDEAEAIYRRNLPIFEACYGPDHPRVAVTLSNLANLLATTGRPEEAMPALRRAVAILAGFQSRNGHRHPDFQNVSQCYIDLLRRMAKSPAYIEGEMRSFSIPAPPGFPARPGLWRRLAGAVSDARARLAGGLRAAGAARRAGGAPRDG